MAAHSELKRCMLSSPFLQQVAHSRTDLLADTRALNKGELVALAAGGNEADDVEWSNVRILSSCAHVSVGSIRGCTFQGPTVLGGTYEASVELEKGVLIKAGLKNTHFVGCYVASDCLVMGCQVIANAFIQSQAVLLGCGIVSCSGSTAFGNGTEVPLGLDGAGRGTRCFAEITVDVAKQVACNRSSDSAKMQAAYNTSIDAYVKAATSTKSIFCTGCRVTSCKRLVDVFVGPYAQIDDSELQRVTVLSLKDEVTIVAGKSVVRDSVLQWGAHVDQMACVEEAVMCEHSHADKHGKLLGSLLGPNSGVSEGEISASLVGPFVGFHHQALLIAAMWPAGKGNVGYGANVGSNHTSKAPDQEIRPGEGVFFGLGTSIKFPSNFEESPYSIIATGVVTLPQRLKFPFSLVNLAGEAIEGLSPAINELYTAWVLSDSVFTVWRNQIKFAERNHARRQTVDPEVFRPDNVDLMISARERLQAAKPARFKTAKGAAVYTDREIEGLGKNYLVEGNRVKGITAYTFYIQLYALRGLYKALEAGMEVGSSNATGAGAGAGAGVAASALTPASARWTHEKAILRKEFPGKSTAELLKLLVTYQNKAADACQTAKAKDARRGVKIIPGYNDVHAAADKDKVVRKVHALSKQVDTAVSQLLAKL